VTLISRTIHIVCLLALAAPTVSAQQTPLPVVSEHHYRMLAKVRPLLFWISRDDVGGARVSWRADDRGDFGLELLIGSDPQKAPRQINRWGYIAEEVRGTEAHVLGVMKQSNEQSVSEAEKVLDGDGKGGYVFRAIRGTATDSQASAGVTTVRVARDLTYRDISPLLDMISSADDRPEKRAVALPPGTKPGFLVALADLVGKSVEAFGRPDGKPGTTKQTASFVYFGALYDLTMKNTDDLRTATISGRRYTNLARSEFEMRSRTTGETTRFQLTYGTRGPLAGVPIHAVYQPRWWFEVQLFLDDQSAF
jgi:hypothetical protein